MLLNDFYYATSAQDKCQVFLSIYRLNRYHIFQIILFIRIDYNRMMINDINEISCENRRKELQRLQYFNNSVYDWLWLL